MYGLPASWISPEDKEQAELSGYTVIDPESVFMTHLSESLRQHADELLTREDVQRVAKQYLVKDGRNVLTTTRKGGGGRPPEGMRGPRPPAAIEKEAK